MSITFEGLKNESIITFSRDIKDFIRKLLGIKFAGRKIVGYAAIWLEKRTVFVIQTIPETEEGSNQNLRQNLIEVPEEIRDFDEIIKLGVSISPEMYNDLPAEKQNNETITSGVIISSLLLVVSKPRCIQDLLLTIQKLNESTSAATLEILLEKG